MSYLHCIDSLPTDQTTSAVLVFLPSNPEWLPIPDEVRAIGILELLHAVSLTHVGVWEVGR